ncbi:MAG: hypothetical protein PHG43_03295, partial [Phenylobacterium sp.]|nr:hypothetical protein [Phenylobacterium sp.]
MGLQLTSRRLAAGEVYYERYRPVQDGLGQRDPSHPVIHAEAQVRDCVLGPWTRVGARTTLVEVAMGA